MKKMIGIVFGVSALAASAANAIPMNYSFTGNLANDNDVQLFNFSVGASSNVTLRTWSYAGGTNAAGTVIAAGGFDPILALFDSSGNLIDQNDDGGPGLVNADPVTGMYYDTYLNSTLAAGSYTVAVMQYANFANGPTLADGFQGSGTSGFVDVTGDTRTSAWAFDILNVDQAGTVTVPEPPTFALLGIGFAGIGYMGKRRASKKAA